MWPHVEMDETMLTFANVATDAAATDASAASTECFDWLIVF